MKTIPAQIRNQLQPHQLQQAEILAADVQALLDPHTPHSRRLEANKNVINFRSSGTGLELYLIGLLFAYHESPLIFNSGFTFLEDLATFHWVSLPQPMREEMKIQIVELVKNVVVEYNNSSSQQMSLGNSEEMLLECASKIIVEIAKREWPQLWPNLLTELLNIHSILPILFSRRMIEDLMTFNKVSVSQRKQDLKKTITETSFFIIDLCFKTLANRSGLRRFEIISSLETLSVYANWVDPALLGAERMQILFQLLSDSQFRSRALDILISLLEKRAKSELDPYSEFLLSKNKEILLSSLYSLKLKGVCEESGLFLAKFANFLTLLSCHVPMETETLTNFMLFYSVLNEFSNQYGELKALCGDALLSLLRNIRKHNYTNPSFLNLITNEIENLGIIFIQNSHDKDKNLENNSQLRSSLSQLLRYGAEIDNEIYIRTFNRIQMLLSTYPQINPHDWDAVAFVLDAITSSLSKNGSVELINGGFSHFCQVLVKIESVRDPIEQSSLLSVVSALFTFLDLKEKIGVFGEEEKKALKIFIDFLFRATDEKSLNRHAFLLLIKVSTKFPSTINYVFDYLFELIHKSPSGLVLNFRTIAVNEALCSVANSWKDVDRQTAFVSAILYPNLWENLSQFLSLPSPFLTHFTPDAKDVIKYNITTLLTIQKRIKGVKKTDTYEHVSQGAVMKYMGLILGLVGKIHAISSNLPFLSEYNETLKNQILGYSSGSEEGGGGGSNVQEEISEEKAAQMFLKNSLLQCYSIISFSFPMFSSSIYSIPDIANVFLQNVACNMSIMNDYYLRLALNQLFRPFILNCPPHLKTSILLSLSSNLFRFMFEKLIFWINAQEAKNASNNGVSSSNETEDEMRDEIVKYNTFCSLSSDFFDLLSKTLESKTQQWTIETNGQSSEFDSMEMGVENETVLTSTQNSTHLPKLGEFGTVLVGNLDFEQLVSLVVYLVSYHSARCLYTILPLLQESTSYFSLLISHSVSTLSKWSEVEHNMSILVPIVDAFVTQFPSLQLTLSQNFIKIGGTEEEVNGIYALASSSTPKDIKKRRDLIRKISRRGVRGEKEQSWFTTMNKIQSLKPKQETPIVNLISLFGGQ